MTSKTFVASMLSLRVFLEQQRRVMHMRTDLLILLIIPCCSSIALRRVLFVSALSPWLHPPDRASRRSILTPYTDIYMSSMGMVPPITAGVIICTDPNPTIDVTRRKSIGVSPPSPRPHGIQYWSPRTFLHFRSIRFNAVRHLVPWSKLNHINCMPSLSWIWSQPREELW